MIRRCFLILFFLSLFHVLSASDVVKETRDFSDFNKIKLQGKGTLVVEQSDVYAVTIESDEVLLNKIKMAVHKGTLIIKSEIGTGFPFKFFHSNQQAVFTVKIPCLKEIELDGDGLVDIHDLQTKTFNLKIRGHGEGQLSLTAVKFGLEIEGSGKVKVKGEVDQQKIVIEGSGKYDGRELKSQKGVVHIDGSGHVVLEAVNFLEVRIRGSGIVKYISEPKYRDVDIAGTGTVSKEDG